MIVTDGSINPNWVRSPSGLILTDDAARLRYAPPKEPIGGDFFSGCGGFALGAKRAGFHMAFGCEWDPWAALTYLINLGANPLKLHVENEERRTAFEKIITSRNKKTGITTVRSSGSNRPAHIKGTEHFWIWDVAKLTGKMILDEIGMAPGELDLLHGSPPCQGFSAAGKRSPHDPRNMLMLEYARLITEIQPKTFTLEQVPNVLQMTTPDGQPMLDAFMDCIEASGYATRKALSKMLQMQGGSEMVLRKGRKQAEPDGIDKNRKQRRAEASAARKQAPMPDSAEDQFALL